MNKLTVNDLESVQLKIDNAQKRIDSAQSEISKAEGHYEAAMQQLKDLGHSSIEEAKSAFDELAVSLRSDLEKFDIDLNEFFQRFNSVFGKPNGS